MLKKKYLTLMFVLTASLLTGCSKGPSTGTSAGQSTANGSSQSQQDQIVSRITTIASTRPSEHFKTPEEKAAYKAAYSAYLERENGLRKELVGKEVQNWTCTIGENGAPIDLVARLMHISSMEHNESKFDCFGNKDHRTSGISKNLDNQLFRIVLNEDDARKIGKLNKGDQVKFSGVISELHLGLRTEFVMEFQRVNAKVVK